VEKLKDTESGEVWALHYSFPPPVSPRVFTQLLIVHLDDSNPSQRTGYIFQLAFDVEGDTELVIKEGNGVKGRYVSVERVREEGRTIDWRMATRSNPAGLIPAWITKLAVPSEIMKDVPSLLEWINKQKAT